MEQQKVEWKKEGDEFIRAVSIKGEILYKEEQWGTNEQNLIQHYNEYGFGRYRDEMLKDKKGREAERDKINVDLENVKEIVPDELATSLADNVAVLKSFRQNLEEFSKGKTFRQKEVLSFLKIFSGKIDALNRSLGVCITRGQLLFKKAQIDEGLKRIDEEMVSIALMKK